MISYTNALRKHKLKATPQRLEIASTIDKYGHITIEKLYEIMVEKFNSISLATIYKNINIMMENSFIQEVKIPNNKSVYELSQDSHSHLFCNNCGEVEDIFLDLSNFSNAVTNSTDFNIEKVNVIFSGICKKCQTL